MTYHDDDKEKEGSDLLEGAVDDILEKDEDEDAPVREGLEDDKWE